MQWSELSFTPSVKTLRQFAGLWTLFFLGLACWNGFYAGHEVLGWLCAALALTVGPVGLVRPQAVRPVYVGWMVLAFPVGWVISRLVLAVLFYGLFTPISLLFKLLGRDVLVRALPAGQTTYWAPKSAATDPKSYFRPF